jgi:hypothetical protein
MRPINRIIIHATATPLFASLPLPVAGFLFASYPSGKIFLANFQALRKKLIFFRLRVLRS